MDKPNKKYMFQAIKLAETSVLEGGGPFGAVIVKDDDVIGIGRNRVSTDNDPTAHAEVLAIREAANKLGTFQLKGCIIYTSCEPCPMCLGAIYWAGIKKIYYGNNKNDAAKIGFDDAFIYKELERSVEDREVPLVRLMDKEAKKAFEMWDEKEDKIEY